MPVNTLYSTQGSAFSRETIVAGENGYAWYMVEHPYKGGGEITQWKEVMIIMGTTTYDLYEVTKDASGIVPDSYSATSDIANSSFVSDMKIVSGQSYYMKLTDTDASTIAAGWAP